MPSSSGCRCDVHLFDMSSISSCICWHILTRFLQPRVEPNYPGVKNFTSNWKDGAHPAWSPIVAWSGRLAEPYTPPCTLTYLLISDSLSLTHECPRTLSAIQVSPSLLSTTPSFRARSTSMSWTTLRTTTTCRCHCSSKLSKQVYTVGTSACATSGAHAMAHGESAIRSVACRRSNDRTRSERLNPGFGY